MIYERRLPELPQVDGTTGMMRVLLYAEDPGAANFLGALAMQAHDTRQQISVDLLACDSVSGLFAARGIPCREVDRSCSADDILRRHAPDLVVVGTAESADTFAFDLISACRSQGIMSVGAVDAFMNAEFRFRGATSDPLAHAPNWLAVTDEATRQAFVELGFAADRITVVGHPHFDTVHAAARQLRVLDRKALRERVFPRAGPDSIIIAFLTERSSGFDPGMFRRSAEYTLVGSGRHEGRTEIVMEELITACDGVRQSVFLSLRLHPKCTPEEFEPLSSRFHEVRQGGDALEYVYAADLVVGMTTSLLAEAAIMGRPVLSILPRAGEREWIPAIARQVVPVATTPEEILSALRRCLLTKHDDLQSPEQSASEGHSVDRLLDLILRISRTGHV